MRKVLIRRSKASTAPEEAKLLVQYLQHAAKEVLDQELKISFPMKQIESKSMTMTVGKEEHSGSHIQFRMILDGDFPSDYTSGWYSFNEMQQRGMELHRRQWQ